MTVLFDEIDSGRSVNHSALGAVNIPVRSGLYRNFLKRVLDVSMIVLSLPATLPIILILAIAVARDGHNPFYLNVRVGKGGKQFKMLKLRTMVPNAERLLAKYLESNESASQEWHATQKLKNDPRTTKIGRLLRKTSVDELPQLWNVIIGDMSLVGPRPMLPEQREMYPGLAYYFLRPGITGIWQVSDRNKVEFSKRAQFDREYNEKLSFAFDIRLLAKTVSAVVKGTGY